MLKLCLSIIIGAVIFGSLVYQASATHDPNDPASGHGANAFQIRVLSEPNILYIDGSGMYPEGTIVTTGKAPEEWMGYKFVGWKVDGQWYGGNPVQIRMDRSHWVVAVYASSDARAITIDAVPRVAEVIVDGKMYLPSELPLTFNWRERSKHQVTITDTIKESTNTRYVFDKWTDLSKEAARTVFVEQSELNLRALFKVQHYLKIISEYGKVSGGGWYDKGETVEFSISPTMVLDNTNSSRYIFDKWDNGDYRNSAINTMTLEDPIVIRANWKEQYKLELISAIPEIGVFGSGWYDKGSTAAIGVSEEEYDSSSPDTKYVFDRWVNMKQNPVNIQNAKSPSVTLTVDNAYTLEAKWKKSYYINVVSPYGTTKGSGYYDQGAFADISVAEQQIVKENDRVRIVIDRWDVGNAQVIGSTFAQNVKVKVDRPVTITAKWKEQYFLKIESQFGQVSGSGWYDLGEVTNFGVAVPDTPSGFWVKHRFNGWSGDFSGQATGASVILDSPKVIRAEWREDYSPAIVNSMIMGSVGAASAIVYRRRKKNNVNGNGAPSIGLQEKIPLRFWEVGAKDTVKQTVPESKKRFFGFGRNKKD